MGCHHPMLAMKRKDGSVKMTGAVRTGFKKLGEITLPCGQCTGCRLERSRQWAIRCMHEASQHTHTCFVTITYADEHLPQDSSLKLEHLQKFMKRLRKKYAPTRIRFYACGEYGDRFKRPHYHLCLFGISFQDKYPWAHSNGNTIYRSTTLEELWTFGNATIGNLTFESAAYAARYILKKQTGKNSETHYQAVDSDTGEVFTRTPEFNTMSKKPGIGNSWLSQYRTDVYPRDKVFVRGRFMKPPRYYDTQHELLYPGEMEELRQKRRKERNRTGDSRARLEAKETIDTTQLQRRTLE